MRAAQSSANRPHSNSSRCAKPHFAPVVCLPPGPPHVPATRPSTCACHQALHMQQFAKGKRLSTHQTMRGTMKADTFNQTGTHHSSVQCVSLAPRSCTGAHGTASNARHHSAAHVSLMLPEVSTSKAPGTLQDVACVHVYAHHGLCIPRQDASKLEPRQLLAAKSAAC
jgi:hypothetical protein